MAFRTVLLSLLACTFALPAASKTIFAADVEITLQEFVLNQLYLYDTTTIDIVQIDQSLIPVSTFGSPVRDFEVGDSFRASITVEKTGPDRGTLICSTEKISDFCRLGGNIRIDGDTPTNIDVWEYGGFGAHFRLNSTPSSGTLSFDDDAPKSIAPFRPYGPSGPELVGDYAYMTGTFSYDVNELKVFNGVAVVPLPGSAALLITGIGLLGIRRRCVKLSSTLVQSN